ncbi:hypothetical protein [Haloarcula pellucida]|uniref:Uncharacterized protein n=1 Tax=Haloarcula pellucida TaxID=1427151 RepID=A0A830GJ14_9EURY|nr:hypothetical protein [Halomicroarcula pellucida]MBX0347621.1 hypothetical protein [Halomicroarcula pellucida]GGN89618.1 hypothetical protein GCM10009030_10490 [Halomicroarcula pellucida]
MSVLAAVLRVGETPPIGAGMAPRVEAHLYDGGLPRLVAYRVREGPELERHPGAYALDFAAEPAYPVTDVLLALPDTRGLSSIGQRLDTLSTKAEANYGRDFGAMVFKTDVEWGSDGYGRLFEARSQLEAHPFDGQVTVTLTPAVTDEQAAALRANLDRLAGLTRVYVSDSDTE